MSGLMALLPRVQASKSLAVASVEAAGGSVGGDDQACASESGLLPLVRAALEKLARDADPDVRHFANKGLAAAPKATP